MQDVPSWVWVVAVVIAAPKAYYLFQIGRRKKEAVRFRTRRIVIALGCYVGGIYIALKTGHKPIEALIFGFLLGVAAGFIFVKPPKRTRVIPQHVKRTVIERDLKGTRFDSRIHHIDHIVPFSKGGDNSVTNLRVITKTENLRRGARMPKYRDFR